jgi:hypothetical protein
MATVNRHDFKNLRKSQFPVSQHAQYLSTDGVFQRTKNQGISSLISQTSNLLIYSHCQKGVKRDSYEESFTTQLGRKGFQVKLSSLEQTNIARRAL